MNQNINRDINQEGVQAFGRIKMGTAEIVQEDQLMALLATGRQLTVKLGLDPTAPDIHLGHAVVLRKLKHFQEFGHKAVIIIGDFTGRIGDPTGRSKTRPALSTEDVIRHAKTYEEQIFKILDPDLTEVKFNSEWLSKLNFEDVIKLASRFTMARLLERDDFKNRYKQELPIGLHEFFYPIMQAYDSVAIKADIEMGGTDQTFNILMGRTLQESMGEQKQVALFMPLLEGTDGVEKMSKSLGNYIGIEESPHEIYGKAMSIPDEMIIRYFKLTTDIMPETLVALEDELKSGKLNPKDAKMRLARELVRLYHGEALANEAETSFVKVFSKREIPETIETISVKVGTELIEVIENLNLYASRSEIRRLIKQGGVRIDDVKVLNEHQELKCGNILKIGKRRFYKID